MPDSVIAEVRNIPAYAGKTDIADGDRRDPEEHPRVCGENEWDSVPAIPSLGTSPRMRGKLFLKHLIINRDGNIPAYAGKTSGCRGHQGLTGEHPRVCGENLIPPELGQ